MPLCGYWVDFVSRGNFKTGLIRFFAFYVGDRDGSLGLGFNIRYVLQNDLFEVVRDPGFSYVPDPSIPLAVILCSEDCDSITMCQHALYVLQAEILEDRVGRSWPTGKELKK